MSYLIGSGSTKSLLIHPRCHKKTEKESQRRLCIRLSPLPGLRRPVVGLRLGVVVGMSAREGEGEKGYREEAVLKGWNEGSFREVRVPTSDTIVTPTSSDYKGGRKGQEGKTG